MKRISALQQANEKIQQLEQEIQHLKNKLCGEEGISTEEAMKLLGMGKHTLTNLVHAGKVPCIREGRFFRFMRSDLLEWFRLEGRKNIRTNTNSDMAISQSAA